MLTKLMNLFRKPQVKEDDEWEKMERQRTLRNRAVSRQQSTRRTSKSVDVDVPDDDYSSFVRDYSSSYSSSSYNSHSSYSSDSSSSYDSGSSGGDGGGGGGGD